MGKMKVLSIIGGGLLLSGTVGAAFATAGETDAPSREAVRTAAAPSFEIEIDPELDARFGPRPVNAVDAAETVTAAEPGARVVKVELDEEGGRAVWEVEAQLGGGSIEALVDAFTGEIVGEDAGDSGDFEDSEDSGGDDDRGDGFDDD
ncbi:PepSY domain-containing protein [Streptomyces acidicola]|uniref:PepSY domain-containing protein n=1 Tax=Streptomyces acidicola TaxID=2596892 RepID=A0A5N8X199_9ACTN|nr:PepSY domain-containing protein [Streptomyces acidicola]MPY53319.1 PepSY domain-containing protein [Streptomyces acidicola]